MDLKRSGRRRLKGKSHKTSTRVGKPLTMPFATSRKNIKSYFLGNNLKSANLLGTHDIELSEYENSSRYSKRKQVDSMDDSKQKNCGNSKTDVKARGIHPAREGPSNENDELIEWGAIGPLAWCHASYGTKLCWLRHNSPDEQVERLNLENIPQLDTSSGIGTKELHWFREPWDYHEKMETYICWDCTYGIKTNELCWFRDEYFQKKFERLDSGQCLMLSSSNSTFGIKTFELCWFRDDCAPKQVAKYDSDVNQLPLYAASGIRANELCWFRDPVDMHDNVETRIFWGSTCGIKTTELCWFRDDNKPQDTLDNAETQICWYSIGIKTRELDWFRDYNHDKKLKRPDSEKNLMLSSNNSIIGVKTSEWCWFRDDFSHENARKSESDVMRLCRHSAQGISTNELCNLRELKDAPDKAEISSCGYVISGIRTGELCWFRNNHSYGKLKKAVLEQNQALSFWHSPFGINTYELCWLRDDKPSERVKKLNFEDTPFCSHWASGIRTNELCWFRQSRDGEKKLDLPSCWPKTTGIKTKQLCWFRDSFHKDAKPLALEPNMGLSYQCCTSGIKTQELCWFRDYFSNWKVKQMDSEDMGLCSHTYSGIKTSELCWLRAPIYREDN